MWVRLVCPKNSCCVSRDIKSRPEVGLVCFVNMLKNKVQQCTHIVLVLLANNSLHYRSRHNALTYPNHP